MQGRGGIRGTAMSRISSGVWLARTLVSLAGAGIVAYYVSFAVADYVVAANTSSTENTLAGLQGSLDRLSGALEANTNAVNGLQSQMAELMSRSSEQSGRLVSLQDDVTKIADAVQDAGIDIRVSATTEGGDVIRRALQVDELRDWLGVDEGASIYFELPKSLPQEE